MKHETRSRTLRLLAGFAFALALVGLLLGRGAGTTDAAGKTPTPTPTAVPNQTISVKNTTASCDTSHPNEWHFVITQVSSQSQAPASITVNWSDGTSETLLLAAFTGGTAHYATTSHDYSAQFSSVTASIYGSWSGQFNLSHMPCAPHLTVTKTASTSFTRTYKWKITKSADQSSIDLFTGDSKTINYSVTVTQDGYEDSGWAVSGTITVYNDGLVNATVASLTDSLGSSCTGGTIAPGASITCNYSIPVASGAAGTNTATATLADGVTAFSGSANYAFGTPTTTVNDPVHVTDTFGGDLGTVAVADVSKTFTYTRTVSCGSVAGDDVYTGIGNEVKNKARIVETGQVDKVIVTLNCYDLTVTKDANTSLTRTYNWTIDKSVTPANFDLFTGDTGTANYTVAVTKDAGTDSNWAVSGTITVHNPAPIDATLASVTDAVPDGIGTTVNCGVTFPYTLAAGGDLPCTYSAGLPDATGRTNTATATLSNTTSYDGTAAISFDNATVTEINPSITVSDTYPNGPQDEPFSGSGSTTYSRDFTCGDGTGGTYKGTGNDVPNTATINETGQSDDAHVTVNCYNISVGKTANGTFTRTWTWTITKEVVGDSSKTINLGDTASFSYKVTVTPTSADSAWAVTGTITITNPAPIPAPLGSVTDSLVVDPNVVDCGGATEVPANDGTIDGSLTCTYAAQPGSKVATNTATVTLKNGTPYGNTVDVSWAPPKEIDESVSVSDSLAGLLGNASAPDGAYWSYSHDFTGLGCGDHKLDNTATFTTNDTGTTGSASQTVNVHVTCASIEITKTHGTDKVVGAIFDLRQGTTTLQSGTTDSNGVVTFSNLPLGTYTLVETFAPSPYGTIAPFDVTLTLANDGLTVKVAKDDPFAVSEFPVFKLNCQTDPGVVSATDVANGILPTGCVLVGNVSFSVTSTLAGATTTVTKTTGADGGFTIQADQTTSVTITEDATTDPGYTPVGTGTVTIASVAKPQVGVVFVNVPSIIYGCSPGYYAQHSFSLSSTTLASVGFNVAAAGQPTTLTFGQAVTLNGGGTTALIRQAASAYLNAYYGLQGFPYSTAQVVSMTNAALQPGGDVAGTTDLFNSYNDGAKATGGCPLN